MSVMCRTSNVLTRQKGTGLIGLAAAISDLCDNFIMCILGSNPAQVHVLTSCLSKQLCCNVLKYYIQKG